MLKFFKMAGIALLGLITTIAIGGVLFMNLSPQFGGKPSSKDVERYKQAKNYKDGKFINPVPTSMEMGFGKMMSVMTDFVKGNPNRKPDSNLPVEKVDSLQIVENSTEPKIIWFGHSAVLLQLDGKNILLDPMLGQVPAPHPALGNKRFSKELPIEIEQLPNIDAVLISHDHYDHLDYHSIQKLKEKSKAFYVPLGVGAHLKAWGIPEENIHELNWWDEIQHEEIHLAFTPSRHFSGRGLGDRFSTLWGSWVIKGKTRNIYFSGDSGYGPHFKEIGEKYGPFDFAMMECGQYNINWSQIHMMPEESVQAARDVNARLMMPIHWGAFTLALHSWTDPVERATKKAEELGMPVITPKIGEVVSLSKEVYAGRKWWEGEEYTALSKEE
jgi:L-ascorbate metabolism protein UlaG (beta-lactamase superfamily)